MPIKIVKSGRSEMFCEQTSQQRAFNRVPDTMGEIGRMLHWKLWASIDSNHVTPQVGKKVDEWRRQCCAALPIESSTAAIKSN